MSCIEQSTLPNGQPKDLQQMIALEGNGAATIAPETSTQITEHSDIESKPSLENDPLEVLLEADDEQCFIEEATVLSTIESKTKEVIIEPPAIPKRNTLRTSRLLDSLRLSSIQTATQSLNNTHNVYLSSEEDASSSADEDSDYDYQSSSDEPEKLVVKRKSQEVTARAVSVIFVGKPCMVNLACNRRSVSPVKRPQSEFFGRSVSSASFVTSSHQSRPSYLPRNISLTSMSDMPKESPSFLSQDPFSSSPFTRRESMLALESSSSSSIYAQTPKTPTGAFQRLSKTISLTRRRSRQNLKVATESSASISSLTLSNLTAPQESEESVHTPYTASPEMVQSPAAYNAVLKVARRNSIAAPTAALAVAQSLAAQTQPTTPVTPVTAKRGLLSGLSMSRRRSMRIRP